MGKWQDLLPSANSLPPIYTNDAGTITRMTTSVAALLYTLERMAPLILKMMAGQKLSSISRGLGLQPPEQIHAWDATVPGHTRA